jgi:hypothetical protein
MGLRCCLCGEILRQDEMMFSKDLPRNPQPAQRSLDIDEARKDAYQHAARGEHDDYPEVELLVRPVVALAHDDALARYAAPHAGGVRGSQFEELMGVVGPARPESSSISGVTGWVSAV